MNREHGYTLIETLVTMVVVVILGASVPMADCSVRNAFTLQPLWPEVSLSAMTPGLGFYGLRNTAWAGHIRLQSAAGGWNIIVSNWGRIRLCRGEETASCL